MDLKNYKIGHQGGANSEGWEGGHVQQPDYDY